LCGYAGAGHARHRMARHPGDRDRDAARRHGRAFTTGRYSISGIRNCGRFCA
jgi:hypothetical protein